MSQQSAARSSFLISESHFNANGSPDLAERREESQHSNEPSQVRLLTWETYRSTGEEAPLNQPALRSSCCCCCRFRKKAGFTYRTTARQRPGQTSAHRPSPWIFPGPADLFTADKDNDKDGGDGVCVSCQPPCWHVELSKLVLLWGNLGEFRAWQRGVHGTSSTFLLE